MRDHKTRMAMVAAALLVLANACTTTAPATTASVESCAARAEPTALKIESGSEITLPKVVQRVEPIAPRSLFGREAVATLEAVIGEDGRARHICLASGDPEWGHAVADALAKWRFEPATKEGRPVAVFFTLTTNWRQ